MINILNKSLKIKHVFYLVFIAAIVVTTIILCKFNFDTGSIIIAISTLMAPLAALQIQMYIEKIRTNNAKKLDVFKTIMATRATPLNFRHVEAINMVSVEFYGDINVINALKEYLEVRNPNKNTQENNSIFLSNLINSLVNLLQKMAVSLELNFYDDEIRNGCYRPQAHVDLENLQWTTFMNFSKILENGKLHVTIDSMPNQQESLSTVSVE